MLNTMTSQLYEWEEVFKGPAPWGPGEGPKGQISLNITKFQLQSHFQRYILTKLCVSSHT